MRRLFFGVVVGLWSCGALPDETGSKTSTAAVVSSACPEDTGGGYPTWSGFGESFFAGRCASCHAESAPDRFGAPEGVTFDTEDDILRQLEQVQRTVLDSPSMPPGGGLREEEVERLASYLACLREG